MACEARADDACTGIGVDDVYPFNTGTLQGTILKSRKPIAEFAEVLSEPAVVVSSADASESNRVLWSELKPLERLDAGTDLGVHAAACCAIQTLHASDVRKKLLVQCSAGRCSQNPKAQSAIYRQLLAQNILPYEGLKDWEYAKLCDVIMHNAFHFEPKEDDSCEDEEQGLGKALFQVARAANHSCEPNACFKFVWDGVALTMRFVALRSIAQGDEICISYLHPVLLAKLTYPERRKRLRASWGFDCLCSRCTLEGLEQGVEGPERIPTPPLTGLEW